MNLFELKAPNVIEPDVSFLTKALQSTKSNIIGDADPLPVLNDALAPFNISFQFTDSPDSRVRAHDDVGIVRAETDATGRIMVDMERDLRDVFTSDVLWSQFLIVTKEVVGHELVHRQQFVDIKAGKDTFVAPPETGDKKTDYKAYLSNKYEMMAYAYQATVELRDAGFKKDAIAKLLNDLTNQNPSIQHSAMMSRYANFFTTDSIEFTKFVALMKAYLEKVAFEILETTRI